MVAKKNTDTDLTASTAFAAKVVEERARHIARWGIQNHESYNSELKVREYKRAEERYKSIWSAQKAEGRITWDVVLLEEVFEALSETDPEKRKEELIQVAAVAIAEAESIDLRAGQLTGQLPKVVQFGDGDAA